MKAHTYDEKIFDDLTLQSCYLAGLIAADGNIYHHTNKSYRFSIGFKESDKNFLERFKQEISFSGPLSITSKKMNNKEFLGYRIYLSGIQNNWLKNLQNNFNITENKSNTLQPPNIKNLELALAYIIGYLDGDGSITINKYTYTNRLYLSLSFVGTKPILNWISGIISSIEDSKYKIPKLYLKKQNKAYQLSYGWNRALSILEHLEKIDVPFRLERKWNKIQEFKKLI